VCGVVGLWGGRRSPGHVVRVAGACMTRSTEPSGAYLHIGQSQGEANT
jgi:hypothetical protein